jgi:serine/threonine protein phosphatase PrpC
MMSDEEIRDLTLAASGDLEKACEDLVAAANDAGGTDNITVALVQFLGSES